MARPKKNGVDYFPHQCASGKTLFILEDKFGNDGYAFWFKMLEYLGTKDGHYIDCNDIGEFEFLQAKTKVSEELASRMLQLLANLGAIDLELWQQRVIWSQNFVDGISHVYQNRRVETPTKPSFYKPKPPEDDNSTSKSTHSIVEYSRVDNTIKREAGEKTEIFDETEDEGPDVDAEALAPKMLRIFKQTFPKYSIDHENDMKFCLQIARKICADNGWKKSEAVAGKMEDCLKRWMDVVTFIQGDSYYSSLSLDFLNRQWSGLSQKMSKPKSNGSYQTTSTAGNRQQPVVSKSQQRIDLIRNTGLAGKFGHTPGQEG